MASLRLVRRSMRMEGALDPESTVLSRPCVLHAWCDMLPSLPGQSASLRSLDSASPTGGCLPHWRRRRHASSGALARSRRGLSVVLVVSIVTMSPTATAFALQRISCPLPLKRHRRCRWRARSSVRISDTDGMGDDACWPFDPYWPFDAYWPLVLIGP